MSHRLLELSRDKTILFDGATGTMLMAAGLKPGEIPEMWNLDSPSVVMDIQGRYYEAGSDVVHTNTFGGNSIKLTDRGLQESMERINLEGARIAREICPEGRFVAGDMGPTGKLLKPLGELDPEEAEDAYFAQSKALIRGGVDFISIETMFALQEAVAAVRGAKRARETLVIASVTFNRTKRGFFTMMGESVSQSVSLLEDAGADVIGSNCTLGTRDMIDLTREIRACTRKPILIQPNAGKPVTRKGVTTYEQSPLEFAQDAMEIRKEGANMIGGCCGTNPEFIGELFRTLG